MAKVIVTHKRTSRMSVSVGSRLEVHVTAPLSVSESEILKFIDENRQWINDALQRISKVKRTKQAFYDQLPTATIAERNEAIRRTSEIVLPLVEKYSQIMGLKPSSVEFNFNKSRWGVCHAKTKVIAFSVYLCLLPDWCIEHVVVHELAHLKVPNHSPKFYEIMDKYFPRWKQARAATKQAVLSAAGDDKDG